MLMSIMRSLATLLGVLLCVSGIVLVLVAGFHYLGVLGLGLMAGGAWLAWFTRRLDPEKSTPDRSGKIRSQPPPAEESSKRTRPPGRL